MKSIWDNAPKWASWIAMDDNGRWYYYEKKPEYDENVCGWIFENGRIEYFDPNQISKESLQARPE